MVWKCIKRVDLIDKSDFCIFCLDSCIVKKELPILTLHGSSKLSDFVTNGIEYAKSKNKPYFIYWIS